MIREISRCTLSPDTEIAVRLLAQQEAYGTYDFLRFWQGDGGSVLSCMDNQMTLLPVAEDWEEMTLFLSMQPLLTAVRTDGVTARQLAALWNAPCETGCVMTPAHRFSTPAQSTSPLGAREVYPLLALCFGDTLPPFETWYADVSHRTRHLLCRITGVVREGSIVATAMTTAECTGGAIIGAVATHPDYRGRGYASACVRTLTAMLQAENRRLFLCPKNEGAQRLYTQLGYITQDTFGTVTTRG